MNLVFGFSLTAVEILGMSLTTDVRTSFDDPISKPLHSYQVSSTPLPSPLPHTILLLKPTVETHYPNTLGPEGVEIIEVSQGVHCNVSPCDANGTQV